jgi:hypothetical protein
VFTLGSGVQVKLFGALVCSVGDIPASCFLGGFKEGVGFSFRNCRMCMATRTDINSAINRNWWKKSFCHLWDK